MQTATIAENEYSLADFQKNAREMINRIKETGQPLMLTDNGSVEAVVLDVDAYQKLIETLDQIETIEAVREGLDDVKNGRVYPAEEVLEEIRQRLNIPTP